MISTGPNRNSLWATILVEELVRLGCDTFFIAPGLRSSPITAAIGRHGRTRSIVHYDERGSAFAALGFGRLADRPAVWVTTSGTALANGYPAVVEASVDAVPLVLLTADRPPELRDTGANQTIQQQRFFGELVRWFVDLPTPTSEIDPSFVLTTIDQAVHRATASRGPVHINCMFRDPLAPDEEDYDRAVPGDAFNRWSEAGTPFTTYAPVLNRADAASVGSEFQRAQKPLCILGRMRDAAAAEAVVEWAEANGIPVLPDVASGMRLGPVTDTVVPYYDLLLSSESWRKGHYPDAVIQFGRVSVSKRLKTHILKASPDPYIVVADGPERIDPDHIVTHRFDMRGQAVTELIRDGRFRPNAETGWTEAWTHDGNRIGAWLSDRLAVDSNPDWSEQALAYGLCSLLPENHQFVLASSLSIRHVDSFGRAGGPHVDVIANRGASGIDGTIATAAGCSIATGKKTTVLIGDQALLHDLNSLHLAAKTGLIVVVMNNDGGGIFNYLPIERHADIFATYFSAPHGLSFHHAAGLFGCSYACPATVADFHRSYSEALLSDIPTLIELKTDRQKTHEAYLELLKGIRILLS